ncbi:hypothetical protein phytr_9210 [Candidatus Phycorickettsia trachydisci]|uniref:4-hydroxy-tetrahydrodipicolinate synthase n=1 Tax=Candidatus Phycorickettsia trachydisci TaxID=2115978 RepID=A0A2P1P9B6_9RICK|nr:4-hydroxy-tetrahydrodipicolinate synthase [Candidatus Phycorickettsia trachydisci]AVP87850.1 hypothetical protein phytr_9210 [Candidatus Phycorickettsia trachydisci]
MFHHTITALVTPLLQNKIDFHNLERLIDHQFINGIKDIVIAGSTGEGVLLSDDEYENLLQAAVKANKKINVIAGCSNGSITNAIKRSKIAEKAGAKAILATLPFYVKPPQEGIVEYFKAIHNAVNLPLILYSVPSRTGIDFADDTICHLAELERVVAFKDASREFERPLRLTRKTGLSFFAGDDSTSLAFNAQGCKGVISVASNLFPKEISEIQNAWFSNDAAKAVQLHMDMSDFYQSLLLDTNPIAIKYALSIAGMCKEDTRPPLANLSDKNKEIVRAAVMKRIKIS